MKFKVLDPYSSIPRSDANTAFLIKDDWDDWFEFSTLFALFYVDSSGIVHKIGALKIGEFDMEKRQGSPKIPNRFTKLKQPFFSLGQDDSYYENLKLLGDDLRVEFLVALRDIAKNNDIFEQALEERVTRISLLRDVSPVSVKGQFRRLANGGASLSRYDFTYTTAGSRNGSPRMMLSFHVEPDSNPPTNIHVLIGRNGVGKTFLLNNMISSLVDENASISKVGRFTSGMDTGEIFASLVSVTFSAFDHSEPLPERRDKSKGVKYSYIGLKRYKKGETSLSPKSPLLLKNEFAKSIEVCRNSGKITRWRRALEMLEADPIFREADVSGIVDLLEGEDFIEKASAIFHDLSSGHKIVLLTITRLIETVEERTLVLLDEPEAHLHPPLLSAFIRSLSDLLISRNGVAIIATHSPVVLQEVPKSCVWKLRKTGSEVMIERLELESFGENVGALTREVFGLEVTHSGFHKLLRDAVERNDNYGSILEYFNGELGAEAKAIVRALMLTKDKQ